MEKGHFGEYTGNARHSRTPVTRKNYVSSVKDDAAHIDYLKRDVKYDAKHGGSDKQMTDDEKHIPYRLRDHAWFAAFAPEKNPKIVVCVLVEHGGHGGVAAAPIAKEIIEKYLKG